MIIDTHAHEDLKHSEVHQYLASSSDMSDQSHILGEHEHTIDDLLEDETIVRRFACGKKRLITNDRLRINYAHNSLQLSTPTGELIAIHKVAARLHYILVKKDSNYLELIKNIVGEYQFIPIDAVTTDRGFVRYQKYEIPTGYELRYEPVAELWETWRAGRQQPQEGMQLDLLVLAKLKWYRVQDAICIDERLDIQTRLGLISFSLRDRIAWIAKLGNIPTIENVDLNTQQTGSNSDSDSEILGKIISKLAIEPAPESDFQFNPYGTLSDSSFGRHEAANSLYEEDRDRVLTANIVSPMKDAFLATIKNVLEEYLEHGETIVRTEVVTDKQGNVVSEKTITTQRSCPKWAIEAALYWE
jgi:hypothetical protein